MKGLGSVLVALAVAGCAQPAPATNPPSTGSAASEVLASPTSRMADARLTCGGQTFPITGLDAPTGAEKASGPEFDALRATLAKFVSEFPGSNDWTWRLAGRDETGAIFVAEVDAQARPGWAYVAIPLGAGGWSPGGMGQCSPVVVLSAEFGSAVWTLDPTFGTPAAGSTDLHILVWERSCSSGSLATGRMSLLAVEYAPPTVTIVVGVRPLGGMQTCQSSPPAPALLRLAEPIGARALLDGGKWPPSPPSEEN